VRTILPLIQPVALLVLASCAPRMDAEGFDPHSPEGLAEAELRALDHLYEADAPAAAHGVEDLRTLRVAVDDLNQVHARFQQLVGGVPVFGGEAIVHLTPEGELAEITDNLVADIAVDPEPAYDAEDAIEVAVAGLPGGWASVTDDPAADLYVLRHAGADHLVWRVSLHAVPGDASDTIPVVFVDAHDNTVVWAYENLQSATCSGTTNYYGTVTVDCYSDGTSYYLEDTADRLGTYSYNNSTTSRAYVTSTSTTFGTSSTTVRNAFEAHWAIQKVYDYYSTNHGRSGIDGAGGPYSTSSHSTSFISSNTSYSRNYVNAYWDPSYSWMVYGDGDGVYSSSLTSLDVGGHELAHGVTQYEANLTYSGESGHLNESFSDVFGAMVERSVLGESIDTWAIGEDPWTPGTAGDALRYMDDPAADGVSYDYNSSGISTADVHYGSGVPNLAFYLLSEGGTHPRGKSTTSVTGIGADAAADIWYLALSGYMTSSTNFSGARTATLSAAAALYGSSSTEYKSVGDAWTAVGVGGTTTRSCTTSSWTGSLSRTGRGAYAPSSSGSSATSGTHTVSLTGPSSANFNLYLQKKSGSSWSTVASSTGSTSTESISYSGTSGTFRVYVLSSSGSGSFSLSWCKP
jgi:Zn-dependent metalloprotease